MRHSCQCPVPNEHVTPAKKGWCVVCGKKLDPAWTTNRVTVREFFNRLEMSFPGEPPVNWEAFRAACERREAQGRERFGLKFLARRNCQEAIEELADCVNYVLMERLRLTRDGMDTEDDTAFSAAFHAVMADYYVRLYEQKALGASTGPGMSEELGRTRRNPTGDTAQGQT